MEYLIVLDCLVKTFLFSECLQVTLELLALAARIVEHHCILGVTKKKVCAAFTMAGNLTLMVNVLRCLLSPPNQILALLMLDHPPALSRAGPTAASRLDDGLRASWCLPYSAARSARRSEQLRFVEAEPTSIPSVRPARLLYQPQCTGVSMRGVDTPRLLAALSSLRCI